MLHNTVTMNEAQHKTVNLIKKYRIFFTAFCDSIVQHLSVNLVYENIMLWCEQARQIY